MMLTFILITTFLSVQAKLVKQSLRIGYSSGEIAPDCYQRPLVVINNKFPGPEIRVCRNDVLEIALYNDLYYEGITIHFHGFHQRNNTFYDGVAYGTQIPIEPDNSPGTYYYHAHYQLQSQSVYGSVIVDDCSKPDLSYTKEQTVLLSDWYHETDIVQLTGLLNSPFKWIGDPQSLLINGKGRFNCSSLNVPLASPLAPACNVSRCPYEVITVDPGVTYRFRIIGATTLSFLSFHIPNHKLTIIEADGYPVQPYTVDQLYVNSGQRYSVLIKMDQAPSNYLIETRVKFRVSGPSGNAILRYSNSKQKLIPNPSLVPANAQNNSLFFIPPLFPETIVWNDPTDLVLDRYGKALNSRFDQCAVDSLKPWDSSKFPSTHLITDLIVSPPKNATRTIVITGKQGKALKDEYFPSPANTTAPLFTRWFMNGHSYKAPLGISLLDAVVKSGFTSYDGSTKLHNDIWKKSIDQVSLAPLLFYLQKGDIVDIVLQNTVSLNGICEQHPWHLHGHSFWEIAGGPGDYNDAKKDLSQYYFANPIVRDTVTLYPYSNMYFQQPILTSGPLKVGQQNISKTDTLPAGSFCGFKIIRFIADNPGVWNMHCHISSHMHMGMQVFFLERVDEIGIPPKYQSAPMTSAGDFVGVPFFLVIFMLIFNFM